MSTNENQPVIPGAISAPVDMARLLDLTDGETEPLRELVEMYFLQTGQQLDVIAAAISAGQTESVRREAHSSGGASATMGITRLARLLLELENQGKSGCLTTAAAVCAEARVELLRARDFLARELR